MTMILSPNMHVGRRSPIRLIVIHTMEVSEGDLRVAESVGLAFQNRARQASAHVGIDADSECRYVQDQDTAWAAPGANSDGLQEELAGRAGQTTGQWQDDDSKKILERGARRTAQWCRENAIPARHLTVTQVRDGVTKGICGHDDVTNAFKLGTHWDPGPAFPWARFLARVNELMGTTPPPITPRSQVRPATRIRLTVDGVLGRRTIARVQQWAGAPVDSSLGPVTWRAVQRRVGVTADGSPGVKTWVAIQQLVGAKQDGVPGLRTYMRVQAYLNVH